MYTVASESELLQYIPFATTRIIEYDDYIVKSELYSHTIRCLDKLEAKVLLYTLGMVFCWTQIDYVTLHHPVCNAGIVFCAFCIMILKYIIVDCRVGIL